MATDSTLAAPLLLTNAVVVAPDRVLDRGTVVLCEGRIGEVTERCFAPDAGVLDLGGRLLLPGLVDLHNDALEVEMSPRPGARHDAAFALTHIDRKLAAAGVTTQFHAVYFGDRPDTGRRLDFATEVCATVNRGRSAGELSIEHHALHRLDVRTSGASDVLLSAVQAAAVPLVSLNDHVPGQGQYRDVGDYRKYVQRFLRPEATEADLDAMVAERLAHAARTEAVATANVRAVASARERQRLILASHDDDTVERVDMMHDLGCRIAEFPITAAAAMRAKERGMAVAMGAPNALRGGSITGNANALDLLARGLVDLFVADYAAPTLLAALFRIVAGNLAPLPVATRLFAFNAATVLGMADRGSVQVGRRADLIVVEHRSSIPTVAATFTAGQLRHVAGPFATALVNRR